MSKRLYVGNLSFQTTEDSLNAAFAQDGRTVESVHVMLDRETGRPRGFAFVEMSSPEDAQAAIKAMDGHEVDGRALRVNEAEERRPRSAGTGGFGGGAPRGGSVAGGPRQFRSPPAQSGGGRGGERPGGRGGVRRDVRRERRDRREGGGRGGSGGSGGSSGSGDGW